MTDLWQTTLQSVFDADLFDLDDWQSSCQIVPNLERDNEQASNEIGGQPLQDGFFSLYKPDPQIKNKLGALAPLADLLKRGMATPEWKRLRENTVGQQLGAAVGSQGLFQQVLANLPEEVKEKAKKAQETQSQADEQAEQAQGLESLADMLEGIGEFSKSGEAEAEGKVIEEQAKNSQTWADEALQAYEQTANDHEAQIANAFNQAAAAAADQADQAQSLATAFSVAAGGDAEHIDASMLRAAMQALQQNPNLRDLADLLGYAKRMVRGEWRQAVKGNRNMTGYVQHELQPQRMASSELLAMTSTSPAIRADFTRRVVENAVVHRHYDGEEQKGQGPMVFVPDQSLSMTGPQHSMCVALEWALLEIARKENRDFISIPFSGRGQYHVYKAPPKGQPDAEGLLEHLAHFYGGGTEPYAPLGKAQDIIEAQSLEADVLLITDGSFEQPTPEFVERVKALKKTKIVVVTIGGWGDAVAGAFAHKIINVRDLIEDRDQLREAVKEIV